MRERGCDTLMTMEPEEGGPEETPAPRETTLPEEPPAEGWYFDIPEGAWERQEAKNRDLRDRIRTNLKRPDEKRPDTPIRHERTPAWVHDPEPERTWSDATDPMGELAGAMKPQMEGRHRVNQSLYIETKTRLPGWILWRSDRMSMAHGVEARVPFLDHPLVELSARIPPDLKLRGMNEKYLLKKIALPHLPKHPWQFKKKAFYTPIREWFFTPAQHALLEPYLSRQAVLDAGVFDPDHVQALRALILQAQAPTNMNTYYALMKQEWIMMLVVTVQMLHTQFIAKRGACFDGV